MNIAYIVPSLINKGPIIVVETLVRELIKQNINVDVYYFDDYYGINFPCKTIKINNNTPIDFDKYDIIHSHMYRPDKYLAKWKSQIYSAKTVSTVHQDIFQNLKFSYSFVIAILFTPLWLKYLKQLDSVVLISKKISNLYSSKFSSSTAIYNGVDIHLDARLCEETYVEKIKNLKDKGFKILGTYCVLSKSKGLEQILYALIREKKFACVIIGDGKESNFFKKIVEINQLTNRVIFLPYLKSPYNYCIYFDAYIMPSRSEGFGLALIEVALTNTPIVCSNIEVFRELFDSGAVSFFDLDDIDSLIKAIHNSIINKANLTKNAYEIAINHFNAEVMANNYLTHYHSLLSNK